MNVHIRASLHSSLFASSLKLPGAMTAPPAQSSASAVSYASDDGHGRCLGPRQADLSIVIYQRGQS